MATISKSIISAVQFLDEPSVYEALIGVRADERSVAEFFRMIGRSEPCMQTQNHFFVDTPLFKASTVSAFTDNSGTAMTDVTLTLDSASHGIIEGDLVMINSTDVAYVRAVTGADVQVIAIPDGTGTQNALTVANGDTVVVLSHAAGEGSNGATARYTIPKRYEYNVQIFKARRKITDIQNASPIEFEWNGQNYVFYQQEREGITELMYKISAGVLYNPATPNHFMATTPGLTDAAGNPVNVTRGLYDWVVNGGGINLGNNLTLDLAQFTTISRELDNAGAGTQYTFLGGFDAMVAIDNTIKALNGTVLPNARFSVDGRTVDLDLEAFSLYGRYWVKKKLNLLTLSGALGETNKSKDFFLIPLDDAAINGGGGRVPRVSLCHFPIRVQGGVNRFWSQDQSIMMAMTGMLAPDGATNDSATITVDYTSYQGLRVAGVEHIAWGAVA